jgi:hypothetical protein
MSARCSPTTIVPLFAPSDPLRKVHTVNFHKMQTETQTLMAGPRGNPRLIALKWGNLEESEAITPQEGLSCSPRGPNLTSNAKIMGIVGGGN